MRSAWRQTRASALSGALATLLGASDALAQDPAPATAAPVEASAPAPAPAESAVIAAPAPTENDEVAINEPPPPAPPEPEKKPAEKPKLNIGLGLRSGLSLGINPDKGTTLSLNDGLLSQYTIRPYLSAQLTDHIGMVANFEAVAGDFHVMDAILQLKFIDELQLWVGQHIPANDRNNFCGPFFNNSWNFAIAVHSYPMDYDARDRGFTFWGLIGGGILKYHLSMVDLQPGRQIQNARLAGRVTLNLLDPENYYYSSGTYFGAQDTLALGAVVSYQNGVSASNGGKDVNGDGKVDNNFMGYSFDLLFEKNLAEYGVFTLEGGYWNFNGTGKDYVANQGVTIPPGDAKGFVGTGAVTGYRGQSALGAVSWLAPNKVGIGKLQPNARVQWQDKTAGDAQVYDMGLAYIIDGFNHRWHVNYRHVNNHGAKDADSFQFGAQMQL